MREYFNYYPNTVSHYLASESIEKNVVRLNVYASQVARWNAFYVENVEEILSNPFVYFQKQQLKTTPYKVDYKRFKHFVNKNYSGPYPDIQIYNFFAYLYAIRFFNTMTQFKSWKNKKRVLFEGRSYNELVLLPNGLSYIKSRLIHLEVCN